MGFRFRGVHVTLAEGCLEGIYFYMRDRLASQVSGGAAVTSAPAKAQICTCKSDCRGGVKLLGVFKIPVTEVRM